jgi:hypothetical protein
MALFILVIVTLLNLILSIYMKLKHGPIYTDEENKLTEQPPDEPI